MNPSKPAATATTTRAARRELPFLSRFSSLASKFKDSSWNQTIVWPRLEFLLGISFLALLRAATPDLRGPLATNGIAAFVPCDQGWRPALASGGKSFEHPGRPKELGTHHSEPAFAFDEDRVPLPLNRSLCLARRGGKMRSKKATRPRSFQKPRACWFAWNRQQPQRPRPSIRTSHHPPAPDQRGMLPQGVGGAGLISWRPPCEKEPGSCCPVTPGRAGYRALPKWRRVKEPQVALSPPQPRGWPSGLKGINF